MGSRWESESHVLCVTWPCLLTASPQVVIWPPVFAGASFVGQNEIFCQWRVPDVFGSRTFCSRRTPHVSGINQPQPGLLDFLTRFCFTFFTEVMRHNRCRCASSLQRFWSSLADVCPSGTINGFHSDTCLLSPPVAMATCCDSNSYHSTNDCKWMTSLPFVDSSARNMF